MGKTKTFKQELRRSILRVSLTIVVVLSLLFYLVVAVLGFYIMANDNKKANEYVARQLDLQVSAYESYIKRFESAFSTHIVDVLPGRQEMIESLHDFINQQTISSLFFVFDEQGKQLFTSSHPNDNPHQFLEGILRQMDNNPDNVVIRVNKHQISNNVRTVLSIGKAIVHEENIIGYLVFELKESDLNRLAQRYPVDILVITDRFQNSILSTDTTVLSHIGKFEPVIERSRYTNSIRNQSHYIYQNTGLNQHFIVYTLTSMQFLNSLFYVGLFLQLMIILVSVFSLMRLADTFSNRNTKALDELSLAIDEVKQRNLNVSLDIHAYDEFSKVSHYFNEMLNNLKELIKENNELSHRNNLAEIKRLESQFSPHFIFNSLESLKYLIRMNTEDAEKFTLSLARLMRYSIGSKDQFIDLETDISYIRNYLRISRYRYGDRLTYKLNISENTKQAIIPKLILQPLIENSLAHGYMQQAMHIQIESMKEDSHLVINVIDNGVGLSEKRLEEIRAILASEDNVSEHIGLYNVHRRLVLQYGKRFGLTIHSKQNEGTHVRLVLPCQTEEQVND